MITIKSKKEIEIMARSGKILGEIIRELSKAVKPGITSKSLDELANELVLLHKVKPAFLGYEDFPATVCISVNDGLVHGVPNDYVLKERDLISIDMGVIVDGYYSDSAITMPVLGNLSMEEWKKSDPDASKLINVTKESMYAGIKQALIGNNVGDISNAVQSVIERNRFGVIRALVGHGVGKDLHEEPHVPNFGNKGDGHKLVEGMVLAIEPMVAVGNYEIELAADGNTYKTKDGSLSAHFEHTVAITTDGPVVLTK